VSVSQRSFANQLLAALRGSVLFTRLLSFEFGNNHFYRAVRQHPDRIISIRLACLLAARTRGTSLAAPFRVIFLPEFFLTRTSFYARFLHVRGGSWEDAGRGGACGYHRNEEKEKQTRGAATWLRHGCAVVSKTRLSRRRAIRSHV